MANTTLQAQNNAHLAYQALGGRLVVGPTSRDLQLAEGLWNAHQQ